MPSTTTETWFVLYGGDTNMPFVFFSQQNKAKKKKKGVLPGGGLKANLKDDLGDYGHFDGGYAQDYEDFM